MARCITRPVVLLSFLAVLSGCSLLSQAPQATDTAAGESPLPEALKEGYQQGLVLLQDEKYQQALLHWQTLTTDYADCPGCWTNLGISQYYLQNYPDSQTSFQTALALDAQFCPALKMKALAERQTGQFIQSEESYLQALKCAPDDINLHYNLGILYDLYLHDLAKALEHYRRAADLMPEKDDTLAMWITDLERRNAEQVAGEGS
ncbi:MAG: hypothetical protein CMI02_18615 [Oceanospirillaceae bacterium]|nr:hypothetical protein [Oceanospirillaceae bacterium]MBT14040.1 hypothetical protein [Oceanospirillaceae bacterium]|tara:strand:+ start:205892 stop:206506 length:615 start_codon:yes stop_codon:yes gene_type:complete